MAADAAHFLSELTSSCDPESLCFASLHLAETIKIGKFGDEMLW